MLGLSLRFDLPGIDVICCRLIIRRQISPSSKVLVRQAAPSSRMASKSPI